MMSEIGLFFMPSPGSVIEAVVERKHELLAEFIASDSQKAVVTGRW